MTEDSSRPPEDSPEQADSKDSGAKRSLFARLVARVRPAPTEEEKQARARDQANLQREKEQRAEARAAERLRQSEYAPFLPRVKAFAIDCAVMGLSFFLVGFVAFFLFPDKTMPPIVDMGFLTSTQKIEISSRSYRDPNSGDEVEKDKEGKPLPPLMITEKTYDVLYLLNGEEYGRCRHTDRFTDFRTKRGSAGVLRGRKLQDPCTTRDRVDVGWLFLLFMLLVYAPLLESTPWRGTLGKRLAGLQVERPDGSGIMPLRAFCHNLARLCSVIPLGLGYLMPLISANRQTLHDWMTGCVVRPVNKPDPAAGNGNSDQP